jgi:hypothetical protein
MYRAEEAFSSIMRLASKFLALQIASLLQPTRGQEHERDRIKNNFRSITGYAEFNTKESTVEEANVDNTAEEMIL